MNQSNGGTPKNLDEAIAHAICIGPMKDTRVWAYHVLRDFIAQKFSTAMIKAGNDEEIVKLLEQLFTELTKRDLPSIPDDYVKGNRP